MLRHVNKVTQCCDLTVVCRGFEPRHYFQLFISSLLLKRRSKISYRIYHVLERKNFIHLKCNTNTHTGPMWRNYSPLLLAKKMLVSQKQEKLQNVYALVAQGTKRSAKSFPELTFKSHNCQKLHETPQYPNRNHFTAETFQIIIEK